MDAHDVERVIEAELELEVDRDGADRTGDDAEQDRPDRRAASAQAGVMATRPATAPDAAPTEVGLPSRIFSTTSQASSAAAGAAMVLTKARAAMPSAASSEPALKPNQPNHRRPAPRSTNGGLCGTCDALLEADALAEDEGEGEGRGTGVDVHRGTTGEVDRADAEDVLQTVGDPAAVGEAAVLGEAEVEDPAGDREVDDGRPDAGEDHPGAELGAVGDGAGDQRDRDDGEGGLEGDEGERRVSGALGGLEGGGEADVGPSRSPTANDGALGPGNAIA